MGIRIIPELDVPGHAAGFRFGNPGYIASCPAYIAKFKHWGIPLNPSHPQVPFPLLFYNPKPLITNRPPQLMAVVARLINELATIFPDRYLHLGGDEVGKSC
jgi:hexosaminidase